MAPQVEPRVEAVPLPATSVSPLPQPPAAPPGGPSAAVTDEAREHIARVEAAAARIAAADVNTMHDGAAPTARELKQ